MRKYIGIGETLTIVGMGWLFYGLYLFKPFVAFSVVGFMIMAVGILIGMNSKNRT